MHNHLDVPDTAAIAAFAGGRASAFEPALCRLAGDGARMGVCWPGLLAPLPWFLYRKMYLWAAVVVLTPFAAMVMLREPTLLKYFASATAVLGAAGPCLYVRHARALIAEIRASATSPEDAMARIAQAGGVSIGGAALGVAVTLAGVALTFAPRLPGPLP
jgi:hypothetical protein